jgi:hypothetical protein
MISKIDISEIRKLYSKHFSISWVPNLMQGTCCYLCVNLSPPPPPPWRFDPIPCHGIPLRNITITLVGHTTFDRTLLAEWSARHKELYLTTHNTHNRQISLPPAKFEPAISARERPQIHALDRPVTGIGVYWHCWIDMSAVKIWFCWMQCLCSSWAWKRNICLCTIQGVSEMFGQTSRVSTSQQNKEKSWHKVTSGKECFF